MEPNRCYSFLLVGISIAIVTFVIPGSRAKNLENDTPCSRCERELTNTSCSYAHACQNNECTTKINLNYQGTSFSGTCHTVEKCEVENKSGSSSASWVDEIRNIKHCFCTASICGAGKAVEVDPGTHKSTASVIPKTAETTTHGVVIHKKVHSGSGNHAHQDRSSVQIILVGLLSSLLFSVV